MKTQCKICNKLFKNNKALVAHLRIHDITLLKYSIKYDNFQIPKCNICGNEASLHKGLVFHTTCGQPHCVKTHLSNVGKLAHKEGRAWNIGKSRWKNKPSKPEQIFMKFLKNIGYKENTDYGREVPFGNYSADFYFPKKQLIIEVDGEQHYRFQSYIERDKRKEKYIKLNYPEITLLRISFKYLCNNSRKAFFDIEQLLNNVEDKKLIKFKTEQEEFRYNLINKKQQDKIHTIMTRLDREILKLQKQKDALHSIQNIDLFTWGRYTRLSKELNMTPQASTRYLKKNFPELYALVQEN